MILTFPKALGGVLSSPELIQLTIIVGVLSKDAIILDLQSANSFQWHFCSS